MSLPPGVCIYEMLIFCDCLMAMISSLFFALYQDTIQGNIGKDILYGQAGKDTISGGNGKDTLFGGKDADALDGNQGPDLVYGCEDEVTLMNEDTLVDCV